MPDPNHLERAGELLVDASESSDDDAADRLRDLGDQCAALAERERGPDHGRLARILNALSEVESEGLDEDAADRLDRARQELTTYREDVPGV